MFIILDISKPVVAMSFNFALVNFSFHHLILRFIFQYSLSMNQFAQ